MYQQRKGVDGKLGIFEIMEHYPIGTKMRIKNDYKRIVREVRGYEWFGDGGNILFLDGGRLNMKRLDLITEVL